MRKLQVWRSGKGNADEFRRLHTRWRFDISSKKSYYSGMNAMLSEKGQVTIPKLIRDGMGLVPGSVLDFEEDNGCIIVRKVLGENPISRWRGRGRLPVGKSVGDYLATIRDGE